MSGSVSCYAVRALGTSAKPCDARAELERDGFTIIKGAFDLDLVATMNSDAARLAEAQAAEAAERQQYTGSLLNLTGSPTFVDLLHATRPGALAPLGAPYSNSCFMNGYIISKPGRGRRLYWHQDWWGWDRSETYGDTAPMFAMMTYLTETVAPTNSDESDGNGCLRVIPGTHRKRHHLHNRVPDAHGDAISFGSMDGPAFDYDVDGAVDAGGNAHRSNTTPMRSMALGWGKCEGGAEHPNPPEFALDDAFSPPPGCHVP